MQNAINRRRFIKTSAMMALGTQLPCSVLFAQDAKQGAEQAAGPRRIRKGSMHYRRLGRTGMMISEISMGGSPVPSEPVFARAIEMGINYVDTSQNYMNGNSERVIGKRIKGRREKFYVATKFHPGRRKPKKKADIIREAEASLARLDTDYVDCYLLHGADSAKTLLDEEVLAAFDQLKKDGKIRFTGTSCHQDPVKVLIPAIKSGKYDMITLGYNAYSGSRIEKDKVYDDYLERSGIEQVIALAREKDVGVVAMKSMAGGNRQNLAAFKGKDVTLGQAKLKWVLKNESVSAVITEMETFELLQENLAVSGVKPSREEEESLKEYVRATWNQPCRMCGSCLTACPSRIPIPDILRCLSYHEGYGHEGYGHEGYGKSRHAALAYRALSVESTADACTGCRRCEAACPYGLPVSSRIEKALKTLA